MQQHPSADPLTEESSKENQKVNKNEPYKSKEQIAYDLMYEVMAAEDKVQQGTPGRDRQCVLDLYAECIRATNGIRDEREG